MNATTTTPACISLMNNAVLGILKNVQNPPTDIVLCADKSDAIVKYTLSEDNTQVFASKYMTCIPTKEEFKHELNLNDFQK